MKRNLRTLIAGLALILVTNALALIGVNINRSGEPDAVAVLTERELVLPHRYGTWEENSGIALRLRWRVGNTPHYGPTNYVPWGNIPWLNESKLRELGFDLAEPPTSQETRRRYNKMLPRKAYLVLEYAGDQHRKAIEVSQTELEEQKALLANNPDKKEFKRRVKSAQNKLDAEKHSNSRLFVIDAGRDKDVLRSRYPDRAKYLIMTGQVGLNVNKTDEGYSFKGYIRELNIMTINVPLEYHSILKPLMGPQRNREQRKGPRYRVELAFGRRLEPWVKHIESLQ